MPCPLQPELAYEGEKSALVTGFVLAREIHYVHSASLAYENGIVFMSEPSAARQ